MRGIDSDLAALQEVRDQVARAKAAQKIAAGWDQATTDRVVSAMAEAGVRAAHDLARLAVEETGIGRVHYKVLKNLFGSEGVWESIKDERTVGFLKQDDRTGLWEVATPVGVVAGIIPTTNPTSTALFKAIISVKGRNAVVISPHPRAARCICETVEVMRRAIQRAGGPADLVSALQRPTIDSTGALMKHPDVSVILATGGSGLVRAAYSSGKPAYGVGPGNVPAYVDRSARLDQVAKDLVTSQSFDNATLCCSEQALVLDKPIADRLLAALIERGAHLASSTECAQLEAYCNRGGSMNPDLVGIDPWRIAENAGFHVPRSTTVLLVHQGGVGREHPLSIEILAPVLSVHLVDGWEEGCKVAKQVLHFGGLGHTMAVHAQERRVLEAFALDKPANRIVMNGPSSTGAVGFSTGLMPSFSLGCGPQAGNITSDNITARHLLNIKRIAFPKADWPEIEERAHQRVAEMLGDPAPRGSGQRGDPGLRGGAGSGQGGHAPSTVSVLGAAGGPPASAPQMAWGGTIPIEGRRKASPRAASGTVKASSCGPDCDCSDCQRKRIEGIVSPVMARSSPVSVPAQPSSLTFVRTPGPQLATRRVSSSPSRSAASTSPPSTDTGGVLDASEIRTILTHAGSGCPMGPCPGCPHQDVQTGACHA
ncbi:MAG: acetaldehyde dehydrogenase [Planctomycetes bacterium]|nr:acetaldehyde dehydrogenase [Planctomycetota bacterium]